MPIKIYIQDCLEAQCKLKESKNSVMYSSGFSLQITAVVGPVVRASAL